MKHIKRFKTKLDETAFITENTIPLPFVHSIDSTQKIHCLNPNNLFPMYLNTVRNGKTYKRDADCKAKALVDFYFENCSVDQTSAYYPNETVLHFAPDQELFIDGEKIYRLGCGPDTNFKGLIWWPISSAPYDGYVSFQHIEPDGTIIVEID
jgi:hypothetical protein